MEEIVTYPTLYAADADGSVRIWYVERSGNKIRNVSGLIDGKHTTSGWKTITGKNIGKSNETTDIQQAESDIVSLYAKQRKKSGYWDNIEDAGTKRYVEPMLAQKIADYPITDTSETWYAQPKLDGFRCVANGSIGTSKHGDPFATVGHITQKLAELMREEILMFDGELYNHRYKDDFNKIASLISKKKPSAAHLNAVFDLIQYHIYDFVPAPGFEHLTYEQRQVILAETLPTDDLIIIPVRTVKLHSHDLSILIDMIEEDRKEVVELGYEGQMLRRGRSLYQQGIRTTDLRKNKIFIDEEFVTIDIIEGVGTAAGKAKSAIFENAQGERFKAGIRGSDEVTAEYLRNKHLYIGGEATVRYFNLTPGKLVPRHGKVVHFYQGKRNI